MRTRKPMSHLKDLTGKKFTRLTVIRESSLYNRRAWICRCDCGEVRTVITNDLNGGHNKSCGCLKTEIFVNNNTTHKMTKTKIYRIWHSMKRRCLSPGDKRYHDYGGRGITVCDRWLEFQNFFDDMGHPPKDRTIDRMNNNKGYSPENCRWATRSEQQRNRRDNKVITYKGETRVLIEWSEQLNINYVCLVTRLRRGWSVERAFSEPIHDGCREEAEQNDIEEA